MDAQHDSAAITFGLITDVERRRVYLCVHDMARRAIDELALLRAENERLKIELGVVERLHSQLIERVMVADGALPGGAQR